MIESNSAEEYIACSLDPSLFMEKAFGLTPDPWQSKLLYDSPQRAILLCSRQSGKSTVSATIAMHQALFNPGSLVLVVASTLTQAQELFVKIKSGSEYFLKNGWSAITYETQKMLQLSNGSRIISAPGKKQTIRSYSSVDYLLVDEAAQVEDEFYYTIRPMLAVSDGKIVAMSTPYGKRGWFYSAWESDNIAWERYKQTADLCPRITKEFLLEEAASLPEWFYKQEYFCEFIETDEQFFSYDLIINSISDEYSPW